MLHCEKEIRVADFTTAQRNGVSYAMGVLPWECHGYENVAFLFCMNIAPRWHHLPSLLFSKFVVKVI